MTKVHYFLSIQVDLQHQENNIEATLVIHIFGVMLDDDIASGHPFLADFEQKMTKYALLRKNDA